MRGVRAALRFVAVREYYDQGVALLCLGVAMHE